MMLLVMAYLNVVSCMMSGWLVMQQDIWLRIHTLTGAGARHKLERMRSRSLWNGRTCALLAMICTITWVIECVR